MEEEKKETENHFVEAVLCMRIGGDVCEYEKDLTIVTVYSTLHKFGTVCEKHMACNPKSYTCHALKKVRIDARITFLNNERKINNAEK